MNGLLSFLLAGATLTGAVDEQAPKAKLDVSAHIYMPDGSAAGTSRRVDVGAEPVVLYVYTGKTLCDARTVSTEKPLVAGNGWRLELGPTAAWVVIPMNPKTGRTDVSGLPRGAFSIKVSWQRLWEGGKPLANGPGGSETASIRPGSRLPLDTIDGAARRSYMTARLKAWKPSDGVPAEFDNDNLVRALLGAISDRQRERLKLKAENGYGEAHPRIVGLDADIAAIRVSLNDRIQSLINSALVTERNGAVAAPVDGCANLSMNLELQSIETAATSPIFEIDYWLVHRDPSGKETTQHQVVRTRAPNPADFFFDDVKVETERGPVTVEVFGSTGSPWVNGNGSLGINIGVSRRYVTTSPGFPWKTKEGQNNFGGSTFNTGEVISFTLPPMPNDDGALVGHRFSVRVRMRVLP